MKVAMTETQHDLAWATPGRRLALGAGWGLVATLAMSALMIAGMLAGISPMPKPIPVALVAHVLGGGLPVPALIALGALAHLA